MHVDGPQKYQMNRQINSFQNMCDMLDAKIDRLARKIDSLQKKHFKITFFGGLKFGGDSLHPAKQHYC